MITACFAHRAMTYIVDHGPGTEWIPTKITSAHTRIIGIHIGPVPQFRSVRGRGVTSIAQCGHPSRRDGLCILTPGHTGSHEFSTSPNVAEATRSAPTRCAGGAQ